MRFTKAELTDIADALFYGADDVLTRMGDDPEETAEDRDELRATVERWHQLKERIDAQLAELGED